MEKTVLLDSVLMLDQEEIDLFVMKRMMIAQNVAENIYTFREYSEGKQFVKKQEKLPQLIILDLLPQNKELIKFLVYFRSLPEDLKKDTKIVLLSAYYDYYEDDLDFALKQPNVIGALKKPICYNTVVDIMKMLGYEVMNGEGDNAP